MIDPGHAPFDAAGIKDIAQALMRLAPEQSVRALEALAVTLANRRRAEMPGLPEGGCAELTALAWGLREKTMPWREENIRRELCCRIARRATCGSLPDPTHGATAFHRVDASPAWARRLLPVAVVGSFLFYRVSQTDADVVTPEKRS